MLFEPVTPSLHLLPCHPLTKRQQAVVVLHVYQDTIRPFDYFDPVSGISRPPQKHTDTHTTHSDTHAQFVGKLWHACCQIYANPARPRKQRPRRADSVSIAGSCKNPFPPSFDPHTYLPTREGRRKDQDHTPQGDS